MNASVSVIVPVFDLGYNLVPHIESLLTQTLKSIEIIIVNDGSNDDTKSVIDELAIKYESMIAVHLPINKGVHEARLAGLKIASAPWIGFMDADDFVQPEMYATLLSAGKKQDVDIVVCSCNRVDENRKFIRSKLNFKKSRKVESEVFKKFCNFEFGTGMLWNKLYKREVIEPYFSLHYQWRQTMNEDLLMNIGCFSKAKSIYLLSDVLYDYVVNDKSVTSTTSSKDAYIETFRAFALAMNLFSSLDSLFTNYIIDMYRTQLSRSEYHVVGLGSIDSVDVKSLTEAVELVNKENPLALALLSAHKPLTAVGARLAIKSLYRRGLTKVGISFNPY